MSCIGGSMLCKRSGLVQRETPCSQVTRSRATRGASRRQTHEAAWPRRSSTPAGALRSVRLAARSDTEVVWIRGRQLSAEEDATLRSIRDFRRQVEVRSGVLSIAPVAAEDRVAAELLLTRAFAGTAEERSRDLVREYVNGAEASLRQVLLIARLEPTDESPLPRGKPWRLVGAAGLSWHRDTREAFPTLQPPDEAGYLSNIAIDPRFRRQGIATHLLAACEDITRVAGVEVLTLHAVQAEDAAIALYSGAGYEVVGRDSMMVALRRIRPRLLMSKRLR